MYLLTKILVGNRSLVCLYYDLFLISVTGSDGADLQLIWGKFKVNSGPTTRGNISLIDLYVCYLQRGNSGNCRK